MKIFLWGTRGSLPSPKTPKEESARIKKVLEKFLDTPNCKELGKKGISEFLDSLVAHEGAGYGGDSPCTEIIEGSRTLLIDGGSGIRRAGYRMVSDSLTEVHLLLTHFHWDHLIGLPFFAPIFMPGVRLHVYAVQENLEEVFKTLFRKPYFPVSLENLGADIQFHRLQPRKKQKVNGFDVTPYQLDHPDPCWGFRIESKGKVYAHCVDTECTRVTREQLGPDLPLYQKVDLMLFDAQYTIKEKMEKVNWGHATASTGLDIAMRESVRRVLFVHHDPASTDEKIAQAEKEAKNYYEAQLKKGGQRVDWFFAYDGYETEV